MKSLSSKSSSEIELSNYKLVVFDIDGTLVGPSHILDPYTRDTLLRLLDHGLHFTLATGKNLPATQQIADDLEIELPLVLCNGSMIETRHGEILARSVLPYDVTSRVINLCEEEKCNLVIYIDDDIIMKEMNEDIFPVYNQVTYGIVEIGHWETIKDRLSDVNKCLVIEQHNPQNLICLEKN